MRLLLVSASCAGANRALKNPNDDLRQSKTAADSSSVGLTTVSRATGSPTFSAPLLVSAPVQCYDGAQKKLCGYVQNATCKCPGYPTAAGGTDGFYGLDDGAMHMMGLCNQLGMGGNQLT